MNNPWDTNNKKPHLNPWGNSNEKPKLKKCPKCAEEIKLEAVVCKHCGYSFEKEDSQAILGVMSLVCVAVFLLYWFKDSILPNNTNNQNNNISSERENNKIKFKNRWNDPGYVSGFWLENTFYLKIKSPPEKSAFDNYANNVCRIASQEYQLKDFLLTIGHLDDRYPKVGTKFCNH